MTRIALLDYGSGNLRSAYRALEWAGARVELTSDPDLALAADGLVVPGVGAFAACMDGLRGVGGVELIRERVDRNRPILGICVGHQVLFEAGIEHGIRADGCGVLPGVVEQLPARRLPHMGWNTISAPVDSEIFANASDERFYFVHSYGVLRFPAVTSARVTWCTHEGESFLAAIESGPISSTQFHPEKSGAAGEKVLKNWISKVAEGR